MKRLTVMLTAVLFVLGCGGDSDSPTEPSAEPANIGGGWAYSASNVSGSGISCHTPTAAQVNISQAGDTFTGTYSNLYIQCQSGDQTMEDGPFAGQVVSGSLSGSTVSFNFDTSDLSHTGSLSGNSMSGSTTWQFDTGDQVVTLTGNWSMSR